MDRKEEVQYKLEKIRALLNTQAVGALWLRTSANFAWLTGGSDPVVNTASDFGAASLLVTHNKVSVISNNIEAKRLSEEEHLEDYGFEFLTFPWNGPDRTEEILEREGTIGVDAPRHGTLDLGAEVKYMRAALTAPEVDRFRDLGKRAAAIMGKAIEFTKPGMSEYDIASMMAGTAWAAGTTPIVALVAVDERVSQYRHPLPTEKKMDKYAMLVLCIRKWGLVASITRLVYEGRLPDDLQNKQNACARIDATVINNTRPGEQVRDLYMTLKSTYEFVGYKDEIDLHHQGGPAGYDAREEIATPTSEWQVREAEVYAWNPSITGVKSEDTIIVGPTKNYVLTEMGDWPTIDIEVDGEMVSRPAILERE